MKIRFFIPIVLLMVYNSFMSCSPDNKFSRQDVCGIWSCEILTDEYSANEKIEFCPDGKFVVSDKGCFSGIDGGFIFSRDFTLSIGGSWDVERDSLFITYNIDELKIAPNESSFIVEAEKEGADRLVLETIRLSMAHELGTNIIDMFKSRYNQLSGRNINLGKIISITDDSLVIENSNQYAEFKREGNMNL